MKSLETNHPGFLAYLGQNILGQNAPGVEFPDTVYQTCEADVASSGFLSSRILRNRGNRRDIPFTGSTCVRYIKYNLVPELRCIFEFVFSDYEGLVVQTNNVIS